MTKKEKSVQARIIQKGSGREAFIYALETEGADIEALQKVVLERGNARDASDFAIDIEGADVLALFKVAEEQNFEGLTDGEIEDLLQLHILAMASSAVEDLVSIVDLAKSGRVAQIEALANEAMAKLKGIPGVGDPDSFFDEEDESYPLTH